MKIWYIIFAVAVLSIIIEIVIDIKQRRSEEYEEEEETEKDRFYRTLRHFIYLITALILIPIIIKLLFVVGFISYINGLYFVTKSFL